MQYCKPQPYHVSSSSLVGAFPVRGRLPSEGEGGQGKKSLSPLFVNLLVPKYGKSEGMLVNSRSAAHPDAGVRTCGKPSQLQCWTCGLWVCGFNCGSSPTTYSAFFFLSRSWKVYRACNCVRAPRVEVGCRLCSACLWCLPQVGPPLGPRALGESSLC